MPRARPGARAGVWGCHHLCARPPTHAPPPARPPPDDGFGGPTWPAFFTNWTFVLFGVTALLGTAASVAAARSSRGSPTGACISPDPEAGDGSAAGRAVWDGGGSALQPPASRWSKVAAAHVTCLSIVGPATLFVTVFFWAILYPQVNGRREWGGGRVRGMGGRGWDGWGVQALPTPPPNPPPPAPLSPPAARDLPRHRRCPEARRQRGDSAGRRCPHSGARDNVPGPSPRLVWHGLPRLCLGVPGGVGALAVCSAELASVEVGASRARARAGLGASIFLRSAGHCPPMHLPPPSDRPAGPSPSPWACMPPCPSCWSRPGGRGWVWPARARQRWRGGVVRGGLGRGRWGAGRPRPQGRWPDDAGERAL